MPSIHSRPGHHPSTVLSWHWPHLQREKVQRAGGWTDGRTTRPMRRTRPGEGETKKICTYHSTTRQSQQNSHDSHDTTQHNAAHPRLNIQAPQGTQSTQGKGKGKNQAPLSVHAPISLRCSTISIICPSKRAAIRFPRPNKRAGLWFPWRRKVYTMRRDEQGVWEAG